MKRTPSMRSVFTAALAFLALCAVAVGAAVARKTGILTDPESRRAMGVVVGLMAVVTGNFLPKMRPLGATDDRIGTIAAAERTAGYILLIMGLAFAGLFLFAPLEVANSLSPIVALGGIVVIGLDWIWVAVRRRAPRSPSAGTPQGPPAGARTMATWLIFGVAYLLVIASLKMLSGNSPWVRELGTWVTTGFTTIYFLVIALQSCRRAR